MYYAHRVPSMLDGSDVLADAPRVAQWWGWAQAQVPVVRVIEEIETALDAFLQR